MQTCLVLRSPLTPPDAAERPSAVRLEAADQVITAVAIEHPLLGALGEGQEVVRCGRLYQDLPWAESPVSSAEINPLGCLWDLGEVLRKSTLT